MALIQCRECGREVSDKAASCPQCGAPIRESTVSTGQQTAKKWKFLKLIGGTMFLVSIGGCIANLPKATGATPDPTAQTWMGLFCLLFFIATPVLFVGKLGAWWYHK